MKGLTMRLITIYLAMLTLSACSMLPESWKFESEFWTSDNETVNIKPTQEPEVEKEIVLKLDGNQLAKVQVGQTKAEVLEILGPSANVDHGATLADHYVKGGEVYDVLYFRANVGDVEDIRALLFKSNQLVGIGWSEVN